MKDFIQFIGDLGFIGEGDDEDGGVPPFSPSLDFSDARNSQYLGQVV